MTSREPSQVLSYLEGSYQHRIGELLNSLKETSPWDTLVDSFDKDNIIALCSDAADIEKKFIDIIKNFIKTQDKQRNEIWSILAHEYLVYVINEVEKRTTDHLNAELEAAHQYVISKYDEAVQLDDDMNNGGSRCAAPNIEDYYLSPSDIKKIEDAHKDHKKYQEISLTKYFDKLCQYETRLRDAAIRSRLELSLQQLSEVANYNDDNVKNLKSLGKKSADYVDALRRNTNLKISEQNALIDYVDANCLLILKPNNDDYINCFRQKRKIVAGMDGSGFRTLAHIGLAILGVAMCIAAVTTAVVTAGISSPVSIAGFTIGVDLIAAGIAGGLALTSLGAVTMNSIFAHKTRKGDIGPLSKEMENTAYEIWHTL